jgi:hypothetical protein
LIRYGEPEVAWRARLSESGEVVPNIDGDYSVLVTAIFRDLSIAAKALGIF